MSRALRKVVGASLALGLVACGGQILLRDSNGQTASSDSEQDASAPPTGSAAGGGAGARASTLSCPPTARPPAGSYAPPPAGGCWKNQLPPGAPPMSAKTTVADACSAAAAQPAWDPVSVGGTTDASSLLVGRWAACGTMAFSAVPHDGVEFGANGRWRLLVTGPSGTLVPVSSMVPGSQGTYNATMQAGAPGGLLNAGWSNGPDMLPNQMTTAGHFATIFFNFAAGTDAIVLRVEEEDNDAGPIIRCGGGAYARTTASPYNGQDNVPPLADGACSLAGGTWDLTDVDGTVTSSFSFDALGNFVGGPVGTDLCATHAMNGTYGEWPGFLQLDCGLQPNADAQSQWNATCTQVELTQYVNYMDMGLACGGGLTSYKGPTKLTKRN